MINGKKNENGLWEWDGDGYIDMIYKVHRTNPFINGTYVLPHYEGYGYLSFKDFSFGGGDDFIYDIPNTNLKISYDFNSLGSGLTMQGHDRSNLCMNKSPMIDLMGHEHGHFVFGSPDHIQHAKMNKGTSRDFFFSPWERIKCGYLSSFEVDYNNDNYDYILNDFSAREQNNPTLLQLPIKTELGVKEYFLISNRRKVSVFDRVMIGDTAMGDPLRNINAKYGRGVYIYHIKRDLEYSMFNKIDIECADGLWNWQMGQPQYPDFSNETLLQYFYPNTVDRLFNDNVVQQNNPATNNLNHADGITSFVGSTSNYGGISCLFSKGKKHTCTTLGDPCNESTDRMYTNNNEVWTSRAVLGDRYDAWEVAYNEVFSPYSSPSTRDFAHDQSNIYIWYNSVNSLTNTASFKIYRVTDFISNDQILALTPPSRPMEIKHEFYYNNSSWCYPKITWSHNTEPDMERGSGVNKFKRYRVYRSTAPDMSTVPSENYILIAPQVDIPINETPHYEDLTVLEYDCADFDHLPPFGTPYPVRYRVVAVDNTDWVSVMSDFASTTGIRDGGVPIGIGSDNPILNSDMPKEYKLKNNYPNPFNPTTKINFAMPKQGFVSLKIYDITGREIQTLVSEVKQAGYYTVDFNGASLSSSVYFYKIQSGDFVMTKRMVLIK